MAAPGASSAGGNGLSSPQNKLMNECACWMQHAVGYVTGDQFYGAKASLNVWSAKVASPAEFSLSQIWVISGSFGNDLNTIEAGWQVSSMVVLLLYVPRLLVLLSPTTYILLAYMLCLLLVHLGLTNKMRNYHNNTPIKQRNFETKNSGRRSVENWRYGWLEMKEESTVFSGVSGLSFPTRELLLLCLHLSRARSCSPLVPVP